MSLTKIYFADKSVEVYKIEKDGEDWMVANAFAEALNYTRANYAVAQHVSAQNQKTFQELQSQVSPATHDSAVPPRNVQAKTKFINRAGVFELIGASEMPAAKRFKAWNANDLLPKLCQEGEYSMARDAPADVARGMNAVHVATNDGASAPWAKDLEMCKRAIEEKDKIIAVQNEENKNLVEILKDTNDKLVVFANALAESNKGLMVANDRNNALTLALISANEKTDALAHRMADIAQDVIAKPKDPQLLHSLAVCALGGDQYAFLRPQRRNMKRSLDRLNVDTKEIVFKSDYVPNAMNVLNKVKENLPKEKYTARHNKITLLEDLTKEDLVDAINSSMTQRQVAIIAKNANSLKRS